MFNYIFSPLYGQHKWLYVFLVSTLNYTLYAQCKWLYVLNYTCVYLIIQSQHIQLCTYNYTFYVIRELCDIIIQKTKVCHGQTFISFICIDLKHWIMPHVCIDKSLLGLLGDICNPPSCIPQELNKSKNKPIIPLKNI